MFVILSPCFLLFQYLNLLNGERLYLSEYVKLIFETDDLTDASPSTVSRCVSMVFVWIVPLIVIRSQFWILETAASFCQIEVPSHRFLIIIGALDTNITYKDKLALALRQSLWRKANTRKFSFEIPLRWPMHIINPVDKTKIILLYSLTDTAPLFLKNLPHLIKYMFKGNKHDCIEAATK